MIKTLDLIKELKKFPPNSYAYAYEGEIVGIVLVSSQNIGSPKTKEFGYICCSEGKGTSTVIHEKPIYSHQFESFVN